MKSKILMFYRLTYSRTYFKFGFISETSHVFSLKSIFYCYSLQIFNFFLILRTHPIQIYPMYFPHHVSFECAN